MHINRLSPARKITAWLGAALGLALLTGCEFTLTNLTPATLPENPSQIYTLQLRAIPKATTIVPGSVEAHIVIDGKDLLMKKSSLEGNFEIEYPLPAGRDEMKYYYFVNYKLESNGYQRDRQEALDLQHTKIQRRNVIALTANRGPVGSRISVLGRGFNTQDAIYVEGTPAKTVYESPNAISFFVPALEPNKNYRVALGGSGAMTTIGTIRVDPSSVQVSPTSLRLRTGEKQPLIFTIANPAPAGGTLLDITTDIPDSVIMPEAVVPQGATSVSITVEGGRTGQGSLFLSGFGTGEIAIPVTVTAR